MLRVLDTWNQGELTGVKVFVCPEIIFVESFFNTAHIAVHFETVFYFELLVKHVLVSQLHLLFVLLEIIIHFVVLLGLNLSLIFVKC